MRVSDLPSGIPHVPAFEGEDTLNSSQEATAFLTRFASAIESGDWQAFGDLFADECWWKDSLTLTFDKRTLRGREDIVEAWKALSSTRKPSAFTTSKDSTDGAQAALVRLSPGLATLDIPFGFSTQAPRLTCIGLAKLIPKDGRWKIWVLATDVVSLDEHPFASLPRQAPSMVDASQRGKSHAQGLPRVEGVLDALVIGASCSGLANTIMLDSLGANVAAFDLEGVPGGVWSTKRYENLTLHHPAFMIQLPQFPVPEGYPEYLTGTDITRYLSSAVEALKLPLFLGVKVLSNTFDAATGLWEVRVQDVETKEEAILKAKNVVVSTGFLMAQEYPKFPDVSDQHLFKGLVQHTIEFRTAQPYKEKDVVIVGSGTSAHDVARNLALGGAKSVTILQRSPTILLDFDIIGPMMAANYQGNNSIDRADFLESVLPLAIKRDMAKGGIAMLIQSQAERCAAFESKGYMVDRTPCMISRAFEERGRSCYMDQPKTFDLVFADQIKIARGEARRFVDGGLVVHDKAEGKDRVIKADGVIFATGFATVDLPKKYAESGFIDAKSASMLENVSLFGSDGEGEIPGYVTFSGRRSPLYFLFPTNRALTTIYQILTSTFLASPSP